MGWLTSIRGLGARADRGRVLMLAAVVLLAAVGGGALLLRASAPVVPSEALSAPRFVDVTEAAGVEHAFRGADEFAGGGVAALDCDADGRPELYLAGGTAPAALFHNDSPVGGDLRFSRIADPATDITGVTGAYPVDVDGDEVLDLGVLRRGENVLLRGLGDCRFERANEKWSFDGDGEQAEWTTAFSATWEGSAALPTLAFGNYRDGASTDPADLCFDNVLVRPDSSGAGYAAPVPLLPSWCALSVLFSDWDRSGRRDLRVTNDKHYFLPGIGEDQLWRIAPGEPPRLYTRDEGWAHVEINGMGIASRDLTGDGYPEVFLSNQADNKLQTLDQGPERPAYRDLAIRRAATAGFPYTGPDTSLPSTAWHAQFDDVNNDGYSDLFVAKGNVESDPGYAAMDPSNLLIGLADGTFEEGAMDAGIVSFDRGRGAALVDLDLDGLVDLVEVFRDVNVKVWRNAGSGDAGAPRPMGHWLGLRPHQSGSNPDAIGAWIEVKAGGRETQLELTVGGGHVSGQLGWVHVGLGPADRAEVRVQWPDGTVGPWRGVEADGLYVLERGGDEALSWSPS